MHPQDTISKRRSRSWQDRYPRFVIPGDGCWRWRGKIGNKGYGTLNRDATGRTIYAHVAAWVLASGVWPGPGQKVCHTCDDSACVRNDEPGIYLVNGRVLPRYGHLFLGTDADNMADKEAKGRARHKTGPHAICRRNLHAMTGDNVYVSPQGQRQCRSCRRAWKAQH